MWLNNPGSSWCELRSDEFLEVIKIAGFAGETQDTQQDPADRLIVQQPDPYRVDEGAVAGETKQKIPEPRYVSPSSLEQHLCFR